MTLKYESNSNSAERLLWDKKKNWIRGLAALSITLSLVIGLEIIAVGFSITTEISSKLVSSTPIYELKGLLSDENQLIFFLAKLIKLIVVASLSCFFYYMFAHKDPFSNASLLLKFQNNNYKTKFFFLEELAFFSKYLPSNIIGEQCEACEKRASCSNLISYNTAEQNWAWNKLFALFDPSDVKYWMQLTNNCRIAYFTKYGLLICFVIVAICYALFLFVNLFFGKQDVGNIILWYLLFLLLMYLVSSLVFGIHFGKSNIWQKFRAKSNHFFDSKEFHKIKKQILCERGKADEDLIKVLTMTNYLGYPIQDKLIHHCLGRNERVPFNTNNIRRIMQYLIAYYSTIYEEAQRNFRTALFFISEDHKYLFPFVKDGINYGTFNDIPSTEVLHEISSNFFDLSNNKNIVVVEAYNENKEISRNTNLETYDKKEHLNLKSIICIPLTFDEEVYNSFNRGLMIFPRKFGALAVDCNDKSIFSEDNHELNTSLIRPFVDRIIYELSLGMYYYGEEVKDHD